MKSWIYLIIQHSQQTKPWALDLFIWIRVDPGSNLELPWVYHSNIGDINALKSNIYNPRLISTDTSSSRYWQNDINELQNNIVASNSVLISVDTSSSWSSHVKTVGVEPLALTAFPYDILQLDLYLWPCEHIPPLYYRLLGFWLSYTPFHGKKTALFLTSCRWASVVGDCSRVYTSDELVRSNP